MLLLGGSSVDVPLRPIQSGGGELAGGVAQQGSDARPAASMDCQASYHSRLASALIDAVHVLASLKVLELTFFPSVIISAVASVMHSVQVCLQASKCLITVNYHPAQARRFYRAWSIKF